MAVPRADVRALHVSGALVPGRTPQIPPPQFVGPPSCSYSTSFPRPAIPSPRAPSTVEPLLGAKRDTCLAPIGHRKRSSCLLPERDTWKDNLQATWSRLHAAAAAPEALLEEEREPVSERTIEQAEEDMKVSSSEYNQRMRLAMHNPYEYHHHLGMYYTRILPKLIVGSQPQSVDDVSRLHHEEGVEVVLNLQQDHDIAYWGIDLHPIRERCLEHGMRHYRRPAVDFDPHSLRHHLPRMVSVIEHNISEGRTVYVHCTAGLGRAPGSAIAYLFWFHNMDLKKAYDFLTSKRPCGPKWDAIRGATYDMANDCPHKIPLEHLPHFAFSDISQWERDIIQLRVRQLYHPHH